MALTKILDDGTDFTGAISPYQLILDASFSSAVSSYDISSTYINSTYDNYFILYRLLPATDNVTIMMRWSHDDSGTNFDTGNNYGTEWQYNGGSTYTQVTSGGGLNLTYTNTGSATGEGCRGHCWIYGVNDTTNRTVLIGAGTNYNTDGNITSGHYCGGQVTGVRTSKVSGVRFMASSGNLTSGEIEVDGVVNT